MLVESAGSPFDVVVDVVVLIYRFIIPAEEGLLEVGAGIQTWPRVN